MSKASDHQPAPTASQIPPVIDVVMADLRERAEVGKERYGTYLRPFNGRSALWDLYQEQLDSVMYLRQLLLEEEGNEYWPVCPICRENLVEDDHHIFQCVSCAEKEEGT